MKITPTIQINLIDAHTGVIEWTGTWADFLSPNQFEEAEIAAMVADLEKQGSTPAGGGAAPLMIIRLVGEA